MDWLIAWRGREETSRASPPLRRYWSANNWSCSKKRFPSYLGLEYCGILQDPSSAQQWKESLHPARELRLQLDSMEVNSADQYEQAFKEALKNRSAAFVLTLHALANSNQKRIADLAAKNRLPGIYPRSDFVTSGGLMAYGADRSEPLRRAAVMVDKILKGTKPADIPVEQPKKFEFVVNLKTAKQIGLTIPPNVLAEQIESFDDPPI